MDLQPFDYSQLSTGDRKFLREREHQIKSLARMTAQGIVQIGVYLLEAKERLGHGKFLAWIKASFGWKRVTAWNFMNVAEQFKCSTVEHLNIDFRALYLIAAPSTPEPVRKAVIERATTGEHVSHEEVKALRKEYEETGKLPDDIGKRLAMVKDVKKEQAADPNPLPGPAKARQMAIASGMHTRDSTGAYQPPMSVADQKVWTADLCFVSEVEDFLEWIRDSAGDPVEFADLMRRRHWQTVIAEADLSAAITWLEGLRTELCEEKKGRAS
jgi:hypothetical protein